MGQRTAILVANDRYRDPAFSNLFAPINDARDLRTLLLDADVGGFDQVELVENESKSGVERAMDLLLRAAAPDDLVLIYFSGHGELSRRGRLYFAVSNSEVARLPSTAVSASWLRELVDECDAASVVIVLDCCYGAAYYAERAKSAATVRADLELMAGNGRYVMTATTAIQQAEDGPPEVEPAGGSRSRSVFTEAIIHGLSTGAADISGLGRITPEDLGRYVREEVPRRTIWQTPTMHGTVQEDVYLARVGSAHRPAAYDGRDWVRLGDLLGELSATGEMPLCAVEWRRHGLLVVPIGRAFRPGLPPGEPVTLDLAGPAGHVLVVGRAGSGKSTLLRSLISAVALTHTPDEAAFFCLESGGNRLGSLRSLRHIRRVVGDDQRPDVRSVLDEVKTVIAGRKRLFREHGLDSPDALRSRHHQLPHGPYPDLFLVVDRWRDFSDSHPGFLDDIRDVANSGLEYGVHVVLSTRRWDELPRDLVDLAHSQIELALGHDDHSPRATARVAEPQSYHRSGWGWVWGQLFRVAVPSVDSVPSRPDESLRQYLDDGGGALAARLAQAWGWPEDGGEPVPSARPPLVARTDLLELLGVQPDEIGAWAGPADRSGGDGG